MKILIIGAGGREHALAKSCSKSKLVSKVYVAPGNDGMKDVASTIDINTNKELLKFAKLAKIDLTIVGPEAYLEAGIVDLFAKEGLKIFGPTMQAARIETSKEYAKALMTKHSIPTASYAVFSDYEACVEYIKQGEFPVVLKYDGIASGKGVIICENLASATTNAKMFLVDKAFGDGKLLVETYLEGIEFTLMALVHNNLVSFMEISQDYKKAYDGDKGLNTGGMGVCSPITSISKTELQHAKDIMETVAEGMHLEHNGFTGFLYGGFMACKNGVKVIEFNARFGDPEAEVLLHRLESDLVASIIAILDNKEPTLHWNDSFTVGVVLASKGYPQAYNKNYPITNLPDDCIHMGTKYEESFVTNGGRVLLVLGSGSTIALARADAYHKVAQVQCENLFFRKDIGCNS